MPGQPAFGAPIGVKTGNVCAFCLSHTTHVFPWTQPLEPPAWEKNSRKSGSRNVPRFPGSRMSRGHDCSPVSLIVTRHPSPANLGGISCPHKPSPRTQAAGSLPFSIDLQGADKGLQVKLPQSVFLSPKLPAPVRGPPKATRLAKPASPLHSKDQQNPKIRSNQGALKNCPDHNGSPGAGASEAFAIPGPGVLSCF